MTKAERLMHHLRLMQTRRVVTVDQLCTASSVSPRTIYRDMTTLARMNVPVYFDNGYRLEKDHNLPLREFSTDDLELLCFCLRNNPLAEYPFFERRFRLIEQKVLSRIGQRTKQEHRTLIYFDQILPVGTREEESKLIQRFLRAAAQSLKVILTFRDSSPMLEDCMPVGLTMRAENLFMVAMVGNEAAPREIEIQKVRSIRITHHKFEPHRIASARTSLRRGKKDLTSSDD
ncbi:MAG: HTH domain-containing protein [bacterium]|nr:HTH domain-containing protein [bacterium]